MWYFTLLCIFLCFLHPQLAKVLKSGALPGLDLNVDVSSRAIPNEECTINGRPNIVRIIAGETRILTSDNYPNNYVNANGQDSFACITVVIVPAGTNLTLTVLKDNFDIPSPAPLDGDCQRDLLKIKNFDKIEIPMDRCPHQESICLCNTLDEDVTITQFFPNEANITLVLVKDQALAGTGYKVIARGT